MRFSPVYSGAYWQPACFFFFFSSGSRHRDELCPGLARWASLVWVGRLEGPRSPDSQYSCLCRGSHSCSLQDQDGHLRDTSEPGGPHIGQLPDLAPVCGGEALHRLLQYQQRQVPALKGPPPQCQGESPALSGRQPCRMLLAGVCGGGGGAGRWVV